MATFQSKTRQLNANLKISDKVHSNLVTYLRDRLEWGNQVREPFVERLRAIDKEISGHIILDSDDEKREKENQAGYGIKPVDTKLPLTLIQIDEAVTTLLNILAPDGGMYSAVAEKEQQSAAKAFSSLMNKHDSLYGHYPNLEKGLGAALKFNCAGWQIEWDTTVGNRLVNGEGNKPEIRKETVRSGNMFQALSMYNVIWDPSVELPDVPTKGEFFATVQLHQPFRVKKMLADKEIFASKELLTQSLDQDLKYYELPPEIVSSFSSQASKIPNWHEVWTGRKSDVATGFEFVYITIWINPKELGLSATDDEYQIWRFTLVNDTEVVQGVPLNNAHAMLPCVFTKILQDDLDLKTKSYGEMLTPFNRFSSFQLNVHQRASRKALYGLTVYNKSKVPALAKNDPALDMAGGKIPVNGDVEDVSKVLRQYFDSPNTENTLRDINAMDTIMQKVLPTDLLKQVTDLERATRYQAAATVQASNRRFYKIAKIVDAQALTKSRLQQMYNIFQYQEEMQMLDPQGNIIDINPSEFREANIEFSIAEGLSGLDKLSLQEGMKDILNAILQSQVAAQRFDVAEIINYMTTLWGDKTNFTQFLYKTEFDALPMDQKQMAFQLLQQALAAQQGQPPATQTQPTV